MPTLTQEQLLESIFSPEPFGNGFEMLEHHKHILINVLTFNVFDSVYIYNGKYTRPKFGKQGCTEMHYDYYSQGDKEPYTWEVSVSKIVGDITIGKDWGKAKFEGKPGFKFVDDEFMTELSSRFGQVNDDKFAATMVHRVHTSASGTIVLERDELHICLPVIK